MYSVDRSVVIVKPKEPFLEWIRNLPGSGIDITLEQLRADSTVYLIPDFDEIEDALEAIDHIYGKIFEAELAEWSEEEVTWPQERTLKHFWQWFDVTLHSLVIDAAEEVMGEIRMN